MEKRLKGNRRVRLSGRPKGQCQVATPLYLFLFISSSSYPILYDPTVRANVARSYIRMSPPARYEGRCSVVVSRIGKTLVVVRGSDVAVSRLARLCGGASSRIEARFPVFS